MLILFKKHETEMEFCMRLIEKKDNENVTFMQKPSDLKEIKIGLVELQLCHSEQLFPFSLQVAIY